MANKWFIPYSGDDFFFSSTMTYVPLSISSSKYSKRIGKNTKKKPIELDRLDVQNGLKKPYEVCFGIFTTVLSDCAILRPMTMRLFVYLPHLNLFAPVVRSHFTSMLWCYIFCRYSQIFPHVNRWTTSNWTANRLRMKNKTRILYFCDRNMKRQTKKSIT